MINCAHKWKTLGSFNYVGKQVPLRRICDLCGLIQQREYLGGSMWKWVEVL